MDIYIIAKDCLRLKGKRSTFIVDPTAALKSKTPTDAVIVLNEQEKYDLSKIEESRVTIKGPGEYEIGGVFITGISTSRSNGEKKKKDDESKRNTLYLFDFDGLTVCHLGDLDHVPTQSQIEDLGSVHVALVPVGGGGGLNAAQAAEVISLLEPSIVIPMHYRTPAVSLKLDPVSKFLKEMGLSSVKEEASLKVSRSSLPEETHVVLLDYKAA